MLDNHKLRLHIEYSVLYVADLRTIVGIFESAYNLLQKAEVPTGRMRRTDRLTVGTVTTGNSVTVTVLGGIGLFLLGRLFATRESFWKSEKIKWEAKSARVDYEEKVREVEAAKIREVEDAVDREDASQLKAARLIERLIKFVDKSKQIESLGVEIDAQDTDPHDPGTLIIPKGRKFR